MTDKEKVRRLRNLISNQIYPALASRVINLQDAGEERAAESWNKLCKDVHDVMEKTK